MSLGSFGNLVFEVSAGKVKTFSGLSRELKSTFASHDIINGKPLLQHTGLELHTISFSMTFRADLGVNPKTELEELRKMLESGSAYKLFIGDELMGSFVLESVSESYGNIDNNGQIYSASVNISLREYIR